MLMSHPFFRAVVLTVCCAYQIAVADVLDNWIDQEFSPSTLSREQQRAELDWFRTAYRPLQGMTINVLSEGIATHEYESDVLSLANAEGAAYWLAQPGAPKAALANEKPGGQTIRYDDFAGSLECRACALSLGR